MTDGFPYFKDQLNLPPQLIEFPDILWRDHVG